jgi:hypothetical protein
MEFTKTTINVENIKLELTPTKCYRVSSDDIGDIKIVVLYDIVYTENTYPQIEYKCTIPYYISDGRTNKFRANILLPFVCFGIQDDEECNKKRRR